MKGKPIKRRNIRSISPTKLCKLTPRPPTSAPTGKRPRISSPEILQKTNYCNGKIRTVDLSQLCGAASRDDIRSVRLCLLDQSDGTTLKSLQPSTDVAKTLHALLFCKDCSEPAGAGSIHFSNKEIIKQEYGSALRSLLLLPPWSVTPWIATSDTISFVQKGTIGGFGPTRILTYLADISMFLNSVGSRNDSNMDSDFYRDQCVRLRSLLHQIIEPMFLPTEVEERTRSESSSSVVDEMIGTLSPQKHRYYDLLLELLPTVLSAGRRLDEQATARKLNVEGREKLSGDKSYLKEDGIEALLYPAMMHTLFPTNFYKIFKGSDNNNIMDVEARQIRPDMVTHLLTASYNLGQQCHMRSSHWLILHTQMTMTLTGNGHLGQGIPPCDLSVLVQRVFVSIEAASISTSQLNGYVAPQKCRISNPELRSDVSDSAILHSWYRILLNIYLASSKQDNTLGKVQAVFKSTLSNLPSHIVSLFLDFIIKEREHSNKESSFPLWVRANMLLLIYQSQRNGLHSVCKIISDAVGRDTGNDIYKMHESLNSLLILPFVDQSLVAFPSIYGNQSSCFEMDNVKMYLKNVFYDYDGNVGNLRKESGSLSETDKTFSTFVRFVYGSLLIGKEGEMNRVMNEECLESHTSERAQIWINVAFTLMNSMGEQLNKSFAYCLLMATSVLVTVFWEVPSTRISVVRDLRNILSGGSGGHNTAQNRLELKLNYCLVLSVIVTSANPELREEGHQELYEMDNYLYDCFLPIANLLTCSNMTAESPAVLILELIHSLSSLAVGRQAILAMVQKHTQIPFGSCSFWLMHSSNEIEGQDRMSLVIEGLVCLIRGDRCIQSTSNDDAILDHTGLEALCAITNLLVNRPTLSFQVRRLLLQKLLAVVEEGVIHQWIQLRLMGAALVAYLPYFCSKADFSSEKISLQFNDLKFVPQNSLNISMPFADNGDNGVMNGYTSIREDLPSLTRLILYLLKSDSEKKRTSRRYPPSRVKVNEADIEALFDVIIPRKRVPVESKASIGHNTLSGKILMPIALSCVSAVLNYLVKFSSQKEGSISMALGSCSELQKAVRMNEEKEWSKYLQFQQTSKRKMGGKMLVPSWLNSFSSAKFDSSNRKYSTHNLRSISLILASLCSIISGFLLKSAYLQDNKNKKKDRAQVRKLFRLSYSVNILLGLKRNLVTKKVVDHNSLYSDRLDEIPILALETSENQYYSVVQFFNCSREALQIALFGKDTSHANMLAVVSSIVPSIIDYCHYVDSTLDTIHRELQHTLQSLWKFYTIICSENGCIRLIEFLDLHCVNRNQGKQLKSSNKYRHDQYSAELITSHDDVDIYVRKLRSSILSCICGVFLTFAKSFTQNKHKQTTLHTIPSNDNDFMFCVRAIYWLSKDLFDGLYGQSSGITKSIYESYLKIIEEGSKLTLTLTPFFFASLIFDRRGSKQVRDVKKMCQATSVLLWNTVCNFDVMYPQLFKSSVKNSMWYLPQVVRRIDRLLLPPSVISCQQLSDGQNMDNGYLAAAMLSQCLEALQVELKLIKKQKHDLKLDILSIEVSEKQEKSLINAPITQSSAITIPKRCVNVRFPNEKLRNWTFTCSMAVAERVFAESRSLMIEARDTNLKRGKDILLNKGPKKKKVTWKSTTKHYASKRRIEVRAILNILNSLFVPMEEEIKGRGTSILAELLPQLGKQRLCSCLEMISATLNHSLKYITRWWQEVHLSCEPLFQENNKKTDIVMAEALACLLAWLSPIESDLSAVDFTIGARRWYSMEKKRESVLNSGPASKPGEGLILGRITKLLLCIEELDLICNKTYLVLKGEDFQENMKNNLLNLDKMVFDVLECTSIEEDKHEKCLKTFCQIICEHIERIKIMKLSATEAPANKTRTKALSSKLRDVSSQQSQEIRKNKRRSRNGVIDDWLELDEEWNEDGERKNDSYLDLEDFLVEG